MQVVIQCINKMIDFLHLFYAYFTQKFSIDTRVRIETIDLCGKIHTDDKVPEL